MPEFLQDIAERIRALLLKLRRGKNVPKTHVPHPTDDGTPRKYVRAAYKSEMPAHHRRKPPKHIGPELHVDPTRVVEVALLCLFVYCAATLTGYVADFFKNRQAAAALREEYYAMMTPAPYVPEATAAPELPETTPTAALALTPEPTSSATPDVPATPEPSPTPLTRLEPMAYPGNPYSRVRSRFEKIQRQNKDIIGWLTVEDLIDEVVVKRDNSYYLNRDYRGYHNKNGAIFMEETCDLSTRPYTLILYGHNMKTGAMFGALRNFEDVSFLRANPFLTFDTAYEDGRYVIFAVGTYGLDRDDEHYVNLGQFFSKSVQQRNAAIDAIMEYSLFTNAVGVYPDDQILLLVTCVDDDSERRIVAARRVREGETEEEILRDVEFFRKR